jgi:flagellar basal body-associated protein FliL
MAPANRYSDPRETGSGRDVAPAAGSTLLRALAIVAGILVFVIAVGSVWALATGSRGRKLAHEADAAMAPAGSAVFTAIGTLRASTKDKPPAVVVATIAFPYPADDHDFAGELEKKTDALRAAAVNWFSGRAAAELAPAYEGTVKAGLRDTFNSMLSLGKVSDLWLSDFAVVR